MQDAAEFNIDRFLEPISADLPSGVSVVYTQRYEQVREAATRREVAAENPKDKGKSDTFALITEHAAYILLHESKDLQIAGDYAIAIVKQYGIAAIPEALRLVSELMERFWDTLHPQLDNNDVEQRAKILQSFIEALSLTVTLLPLTRHSSYSYWHWTEAQALEMRIKQSPSKKAELLSQARITNEQWEQAVASTSREHFEWFLEAVSDSQNAHVMLQAVIAKNFGDDALYVQSIQEILARVRALLVMIVQKKREVEPELPPSADPAQTAESYAIDPRASSHMNADSSPERSSARPDRTQAVQYLRSALTYLRNDEPSSPVIYLIERAIRWMSLPFTEILQELVKDEPSRTHARELLGATQNQGTSDNH